jgi:DNA-binding transcriptional LysR family regulator
MRLDPGVNLSVNGHSLTNRQLEVVRAIFETGSQKAAAARLGISTPVLHRYLHQIEAKAGTRLVETTPRGTVLNDDGEAVAREYLALLKRMDRSERLVVGCTIITEDLLLSSLSSLNEPDVYDLIISDDERNMKDFNARMMDLIVLDDPLYAFETDGPLWEPVAEDRLIHVERGPAYGRFRFGAQRLGFRHLDTNHVSYRVERSEHSLAALLRSNMSFFVNESLALKKGHALKSATDPELLRHQIIAMHWEPRPEVMALVRELARRSLAN